MSTSDPSRFDSSSLTEEQQSILAAFFARRKRFDTFLVGRVPVLLTCPCCGFPSIESRGGYEICIVCFWEDDFQDDADADKIKGGPNGSLSLTEGRLEISEKLATIVQTEGGVVNEEPESVIALIALYDGKLRAIKKTIPGDARRSHPGYEKYDQARKQLLYELVVK